MRSDPLLFSSFDMPYGDERDIPKANTFAYWRDLANRVIDPNDSMVFEGSGLTRWGILNSLSYWGELKIRHLLDPMHIEGNVGKAIIKQLYGEKALTLGRLVKILKGIPMCGLLLILTQVLSSDHQLHGHVLHRNEKSFEIA